MSISSEITRISGNVSDALAAIANKGVTVPSGSNSDDLATLIAQITGGGGGGADTTPYIERTLSECINSTASYVGSSAFYWCSSLQRVELPSVKTVYESAFAYCDGLSTVSFPNCEMIEGAAFTNCGSLTVLSFPACTTISGVNHFNYCQRVSTAYFPNLTSINGTFGNCFSLTSIYAPKVERLGGGFAGCRMLPSVHFPVCSYITANTFSTCSALSMAVFGENANGTASYIASSAFRNCRSLLSLYLLDTKMFTLSSRNAFYSTPISNYTTYTGGVYGSIFVRESLYASYIAATNWAYFSSRFVSMTDSEITAFLSTIN